MCRFFSQKALTDSVGADFTELALLGVTMVLLFIDVIQAIQLNVERGVTVIATAMMLIIMYKKMKIW